MDYITLNDYNRRRIKSTCSPAIEMSWEDPDLIYTIAGDLPKIRETYYDSKVHNELEALKEHYYTYDFIKTDRESFLSKLKDLIQCIRSQAQYWYGVDAYRVETCIDIQKACLMRGDGGAGKTYFVMKLEEELTVREIPHLCIYGKYENDCQHVDFEEINSLSKNKRFVFVIDAINEMQYKAQVELCNTLKELVCNKGLQVLITYRNKTLDNNVYDLLKGISLHEYSFAGVSYESAIESMVRLGIPDVYKYEDILFSNNALLLSNLMSVLNSDVIISGSRNNIASITHILESGIKSRIDRQEWEVTKKIAAWMAEHESHVMPVDELASITANPDSFISIMEQNGYLSVYTYKEQPNIYFASETLMDYLIARSMLGPLGALSMKKRVDYITRKTKAMPSIKEALIIALFDKYKNKYQELKTILISTDLMDEFSPEVLAKIKFEKDNIQSFLKVFKIKKPIQWLLYIGGYSDKPFNCTNYLNTFFINNTDAQLELTNLLEGNYILGNVVGRLKNLLYFVAFNGAGDPRIGEACYFALWCTSAPNMTIRHLAMKLLYDVASKNDEFRHWLTEILPDIIDPYIIEAIIYTLAYCDPGIKKDTEDCFQKLIQNTNFHYARDIKRISTYMGDPHMYITWEKRNLYKKDDSMIVSEKFQRVLSTVDLMDKYLLPFRYWGHNDFREFDLFLDESKKAITRLNYDLNNNYECLRNNYECRNSDYFKEYLFDVHNVKGTAVLDNVAVAASYEAATRSIFAIFREDLYDDNRKIGDDFHNSKYRKLIDISTDYFMGSIMCNYYKKDFICYDGMDGWGFELYDPIPYQDSEEINITSPITVFNSNIEQIGAQLIGRIELPESKDEQWHNDSSISEKNLLNLLKPITIKNEEWVLLAGTLKPAEREDHSIIWRDTYIINCCTSDDIMLRGIGDRYLTIEIPTYTGNLEYYSMCTETPALCKDVRSITTTDEFEDSTLVLPPADLIKYFKLTPNYRDMSWVDHNGNAIILCDNCKKSYYTDPAVGLVLIKKESLEKYLKYGTLKHFAFTERLIEDKGFSNESCFHYEIQAGKIIRKYKNTPRGDDGVEYHESDAECINCPYNLYEKKMEYKAEATKQHDEFMEMLNKYASSDWDK